MSGAPGHGTPSPPAAPGLRGALGRRWPLLALGLVFSAHLLLTVGWLRQDTPLVFKIADDFAHMSGLQQLVTCLQTEGPVALLRHLTARNSHYAYLAHYPLALAAQLWEPLDVAARAANALYVLLLLAGLYGLGVACHGRTAGVLAAALATLMPAVFGGWRTVGLDLPLLCVTPLCMLALLRSEDLWRPGRAALFGLALGLAALVKTQALLFVGGPALLCLARGLARAARAPGRPWRRPLLGAALALAALLATTAAYWQGRAGYLLAVLTRHLTTRGMEEIPDDVTFLGGLSFFGGALPYITGGPLLLALALAVPLFWRAGRQRAPVLVWLVLPFLLHAWLPVRDERYLHPLAPAAALVVGVGLASLRPLLRALSAGVLGGGAALVWLAVTLGDGLALPGDAPEHGPPQNRCTDSPARALLCAGNVRYVRHFASLQALAPERKQLARELYRALAAAHPQGRRVVLYLPFPLLNEALLAQRGLPGLRLVTSFTWAAPWAPPPAGYRRYLLLDWDPHTAVGALVQRSAAGAPAMTPLRALPGADLRLWRVPAGADLAPHMAALYRQGIELCKLPYGAPVCTPGFPYVGAWDADDY